MIRLHRPSSSTRQTFDRERRHFSLPLGKKTIFVSFSFPFLQGRPQPCSSRFYPVIEETDATTPSSSLEPRVADRAAAAAPTPATAAAAAADNSNTKDASTIEVCSPRLALIKATDAGAAAMDAAEQSIVEPASTAFPGLHMASLVAGPGGLRCLVVGLAVLQKICPPVHRRLARTVSERYETYVAGQGAREIGKSPNIYLLLPLLYLSLR